MRIVALLAAYNEERFIGNCIRHLADHGVLTYLIDNESVDRTVEIAESYKGRGLIGLETLPRKGGVHKWHNILRRKEELAVSLDADWFIHVDPDEIRLPPRPSEQTLAEAVADVDSQGYDAINFLEYTFVPTSEEPEHDHPDYLQTMRHYYPFVRDLPHRRNAWKRQPGRVNLVKFGGHRVVFAGQRTYPEFFKMKHYQFLSLAQARIKYLQNKSYGAGDKIATTWRGRLAAERMGLPSSSELNTFTSDDELSVANPRARHVIEDWALPEADRQTPERPVDGKRAAAVPRESPVPSGRLIVAGFHRSGTSLTTQLLQRSGLFVGDALLGAHRSNRHGHFEDREVFNLHNDILESNGFSWQFGGSSLPTVGEEHRARMREIAGRRDAAHKAWGFKDPRVCLFLEEWKAVVPNARVLLVYRHFSDTARSLHARAANGLFHGSGRPEYHRRFLEEPDLALKMWLAHNKALVDFAEAHPEDVLAVSFGMLQKNFPLIEALNWHWGLALAGTPTSEVLDPETDPEPLARQIVSDESLIAETLKTWKALEGLRRRTEELVGWPVKAQDEPTKRAFYKPTNAYAAELKREFLGHDLRRAQEQRDRAIQRLEEASEKLKKASEKPEQAPEKANGTAVPPPRIAELQAAETDLKLILKKLAGSRAAPLFRLKEEFRQLERRYLN